MGSWAECMHDVITLASVTTENDDGEESYGTPREITCIIEGEEKTVLTSTGEMVEVTTLVISDSEILKTDLIWLPGTDTTEEACGQLPSTWNHTRDLEGGDDLWEVRL